MAEQEKPKRKTHTSSKVKNRWKSKHRERIVLEMPKGTKDVIRSYAAAELDENGDGQTMTGFIMGCVYACHPELQGEIQRLKADDSATGEAIFI